MVRYFVIGLCAVYCCEISSAIFIRPDLKKVPVARLVENLEKLLKDDPKNAQLMLNLARTYAMAYAKKADELDTQADKDGAWMGYAPTMVPFGKVESTEDKEKVKAAKEYLARAKSWYEASLKAQADNAVAMLGLAWVTEQAGDNTGAIKQYRAIIEDAWVKRMEKDLRSLGLTGETITTEAAVYLIPLLDKEKDKDEIAELKARVAKLKKLPRPVTPIAVPLADGLPGSELEDKTARVKFDADASGDKKEWSWITPKAAWLVYDPQGKGEVTSGMQFFGAVTFRLFWNNGYSALAALDNNHDGKLAGEELAGISLWHDVNGNGIADQGEIQPVAGYGIVSVSCRCEVLKSHADRIAFSPNGVTFQDGKTRPTYDFILRAK